MGLRRLLYTSHREKERSQRRAKKIERTQKKKKKREEEKYNFQSLEYIIKLSGVEGPMVWLLEAKTCN